MGNQGQYVAAGNLLWVDVLRSPSPGVPLSFRTVQELADFRWPADTEPSFARVLLQVVGPVPGHVPDVPQALQTLTPEGYVHSMLHACARQLPEHKDRWSLVLRSVPLCFVEEPDDEWIASWNNRNAIAQDFESLGRTAFQMAQEMKLLKKRWETEANRALSNTDFQRQIKDSGLKKASSQDELSTNLICTALAVAEKLTGEEVLTTIRDLEDRYGRGSCLNSMQKLHALATKTTPAKRGFIFQALRDMIFRNMVDNDDVSKSFLVGDGHNTCGFVALTELKLDCLAHFKAVVLPRAQIREQDRVVIAEALLDHATYNKSMLGDDVAWQGMLLESSMQALRFLEVRRGVKEP